MEIEPTHVPVIQDVAESEEEEEIDSAIGLEEPITPTPVVDNEGESSEGGRHRAKETATRKRRNRNRITSHASRITSGNRADSTTYRITSGS